MSIGDRLLTRRYEFEELAIKGMMLTLECCLPEIKGKNILLEITPYRVELSLHKDNSNPWRQNDTNIDTFVDCVVFYGNILGISKPEFVEDTDVTPSLEWFRQFYSQIMKHSPISIKIKVCKYLLPKEAKVCREFHKSLYLDQDMECALNGSDYRPLKPPKAGGRKKEAPKPSSRGAAASTAKAKPSNRGSKGKPRKSATP